MTNAKLWFTNVLGIAIGSVVFIVVTYILAFILGLLMKIPFVPNLLSFPSTPQLYTATIMNLGATGAALFTCRKVCKSNGVGRKWGLILFSAFLCLSGAALSVLTFIGTGFSDVLWSYIVATVFCGYIFVDSLKKTPIEELC